MEKNKIMTSDTLVQLYFNTMILMHPEQNDEISKDRDKVLTDLKKLETINNYVDKEIKSLYQIIKKDLDSSDDIEIENFEILNSKLQTLKFIKGILKKEFLNIQILTPVTKEEICEMDKEQQVLIYNKITGKFSCQVTDLRCIARKKRCGDYLVFYKLEARNDDQK